MIYSCQVIRKHLFLNTVYTLQVYEDKILIGQLDRQAKYELEIGLQNKIGWRCDETGVIQEMGIRYQNNCKWFQGKPKELSEVKKILTNRIFFHNIANFYTSNEQIGSGASCKVIKIQDITTKQHYAAKCISKDYITKKKTPDRLNRLYNEINILRSLADHQNLIKLIDIFEGEQTYYLVFEYLEGETLHKFLKQQISPIPDDCVRKIIIQLLLGIKQLHSQKYIHRDMKLENIVLTKPMDIKGIKIIDFGLAIVANQQVPFAVCGTPGYIAPEILQHDDSTKNQKFKFTYKVDLFGIGVILYRLMNRQPLFESDKTKELLQLNKKCQLSKHHIKHYSTELNNVLYGLLEQNPIKRLSSEEAIKILTIQNMPYEIGGSFTTTKSHQNNDLDEFEVDIDCTTVDHAKQPLQFQTKIFKAMLENSYHQNDDNQQLVSTLQRSYYPSFSLRLSEDYLDTIQKQTFRDEILEPDLIQENRSFKV